MEFPCGACICYVIFAEVCPPDITVIHDNRRLAKDGLLGIADTLMVSYAGEAAVSEVSLVNQLNNVFIFVFGAVASGGAVVASQYIGRNDRENGVTASSQLLMITVLISAFLMGISILFRSQILSLLFGRVEPDVMRASLTYLVISALSFPALAVYNSAAALFRSMEFADYDFNAFCTDALQFIG